MALKGNFTKCLQKLEGLEAVASGEVQEKILTAIAGELLDLVLEGFTESRDPYGEAWASLKYRDGMPLRDKGHLASGFTPSNVKVTGQTVSISNPVPYGVHHQFGAPRANIPARPMLPNAGTMPEVWGEMVDEAALEALQLYLKK